MCSAATRTGDKDWGGGRLATAEAGEEGPRPSPRAEAAAALPCGRGVAGVPDNRPDLRGQ